MPVTTEAATERRYCEDCRFYRLNGFDAPETAVCAFPKELSGRALVSRQVAPLPRRCADERIWPSSTDSCGPEASRFEAKPDTAVAAE